MNIRYIIALSVYTVCMLLIVFLVLIAGSSTKSHFTPIHYIVLAYATHNIGAGFIFTYPDDKTTPLGLYSGGTSLLLTLALIILATVDVLTSDDTLMSLMYPILAFSGGVLSLETFLALRRGFAIKRKRVINLK